MNTVNGTIRFFGAAGEAGSRIVAEAAARGTHLVTAGDPGR